MTKRKRVSVEPGAADFEEIVQRFDDFVSSLDRLIESTPEENFTTKGLNSDVEDRAVIAKVLKRMRVRGQLSWMDQYLKGEHVSSHSHPAETVPSTVPGGTTIGNLISSLGNEITVEHQTPSANTVYGNPTIGTNEVKTISDTKRQQQRSTSPKLEPFPPALPPIHDVNLQRQAFTHRSYATACAPAQSSKVFLTSLHNERLEFLGDSFLNHAVTKMLFARMPDAREGELSLLRAELIGNTTAAGFGRLYGFDKRLLLNDTAERDGVRKTPKVIADTFEAYLGALMLDGPDGVVRADTWLKKLMNPRVEEYLRHQVSEPVDTFAKQKVWNHVVRKYPPSLTNLVQEDGGHARLSMSVKYEWVDGGGGNEGGFIVAAKLYVPDEKIDGQELGRGFGLNKKEAEHRAAMNAVQVLGI